MADTRPDILLPANTPVDLYAALNGQDGYPPVNVGAIITVQNKSSSEIELHSGVDAPISGDGSIILTSRGDTASNEINDLGAWALSRILNGLVNVRVG